MIGSMIEQRRTYAIVAATLGALGLALASPGLAANEGAAEPKDKTSVIKIVKKHRQGEHADHLVTKIIECGDSRTVEADSETKGEDGKIERTRVVICAKGDASDGEMAKKLKEARDRIATEDDLSDKARTQALAALDTEIERLNIRAGVPYPRQ